MTENPEKERNEAVQYLNEKIQRATEFKTIAKTRFEDMQSRSDKATSLKSFYALESIVFDDLQVIYEGLKGIIEALYEMEKARGETSTLSEQLSKLQGEFEKHKPLLDQLKVNYDATKKYLGENR